MRRNCNQLGWPEKAGVKVNDDLGDDAWSALHSWSPEMDDVSTKKMLAEAEDDPAPRFEFAADPANPRRTVDAVRAAMEVDRALRASKTGSVEIGVRTGRLVSVCVETKEEIPTAQSIDALVEKCEFQTVSVTRAFGRTRLTVREHRPLR